jgi:hypothetical protein
MGAYNAKRPAAQPRAHRLRRTGTARPPRLNCTLTQETTQFLSFARGFEGAWQAPMAKGRQKVTIPVSSALFFTASSLS